MEAAFGRRRYCSESFGDLPGELRTEIERYLRQRTRISKGDDNFRLVIETGNFVWCVEEVAASQVPPEPVDPVNDVHTIQSWSEAVTKLANGVVDALSDPARAPADEWESSQ